ncbi:MAG: SDR family oxidoreductase [Burkholderiales bacterium]|nr:SDR family oxidoreductase [Anaerolineae bacterium]
MPNNPFDLTGKVAVITGGTGVLGSAMTKALAGAGATVVPLARTEANAKALADEITATGGMALGIAADVLDKAALEIAREAVIGAYGKVDILLNGAGGNRPEATAVPGQRTFFDLPEEALQWVFNLNFTGSIMAAQVFGKPMTEQGSGVILNISSMAADRSLTRVLAYGGAKAAINNFTHWLAVYMAKEHSPNIRVNAIAPGFYLGEQNRFLLIDEKTGSLTPRGQLIIDHTPMARFGVPDDLSGTLLWLASDASRFVTGIVVPVDGGFSAYSGV